MPYFVPNLKVKTFTEIILGTKYILFADFLIVFRNDKPKLKLEQLNMIESSCFVFCGTR